MLLHGSMMAFMKQQIPWLFCLLSAFVLGWWSALQWQDSQQPVAQPGAVQWGDSLQPEEANAATTSAAGSGPESTTKAISPDVIRWLHSGQPEALIAHLESPSLGPRQQQLDWQELDRYLLQLQSARRWPLLVEWLEPLYAWNADYELWTDLLAQSYSELQQPQAALSVLFAAHAASLSFQRQQQLLDRIESLLAEQVAQQQSVAPTQLAKSTELMNLLQQALEKQPQYAPFALLLADVYEQSGEWEQALLQLQMLPYSATHEARVEEYKVRLSNLLARQQRAAQGISLQRNLGQFVVTAVFDGQVALNLMIDTGATITALNPRAIALLQQHTGLHTTDQEVQVNTANGVVVSPLFEIGTLQIGDWQQFDVQLLQVNLSSEEVDGLLGMNFLGQFAFSIDQEQSLLFLDNK